MSELIKDIEYTWEEICAHLPGHVYFHDKSPDKDTMILRGGYGLCLYFGFGSTLDMDSFIETNTDKIKPRCFDKFIKGGRPPLTFADSLSSDKLWLGILFSIPALDESFDSKRGKKKWLATDVLEYALTNELYTPTELLVSEQTDNEFECWGW